MRTECGSNKHNYRAGEGEVQLHLDFLLLFTKRYFSGRLHSSQHFIEMVEQSTKSLVLFFFFFFLHFLMQIPYWTLRVAFLLRHPDLCFWVGLACPWLLLPLVLLFKGTGNVLSLN